jgi:Protein of unknown function (DUF1566)
MRVVMIFAAMLIANTTWADCKDADSAFMARFTVKAEEVYDWQTDLTWQRCAMGQRWVQSSGCLGDPAKFTFDEAQVLTNGKSRVPTIEELQSIVAEYCSEPAVDPVLFPGTPSEQFWSNAFYSPMAFYVSFRNGSSNPTYYSDSRYNVRLVRSGR